MQPNRLLALIVSGALLSVASGSQAQDQATHFTAADGTQVTLHSGQPAPEHYGPAPAFAQLDVNHDGYISREEAEAYPPLLNDFDNVVHHAERISQRQFEHWNQTRSR